MRLGLHDTDDQVLVVAEIGNNHEGDPDVARRLVREAAAAGAGAVKLQTFRVGGLVRARDTARFQQLSRFELAPDVVVELAALARELGLAFMSTPLDLESADLLEPLVDAFKIASADNDFVPLLERVGRSGKPVIVSTGLVDVDGARRARDLLAAAGAPEVCVLHAITAYPARPESLNLAAIPLLARALDCTVGYSDHTLDNDACVAAVALGARIVEKHFTLDHNHSDFRDHRLSAEPEEMRALVERVAAAETMLGRSEKRVQPQEAELAEAVRRSIAAARDLPTGHRLAWEDLAWLRPRDGLAPGEEELLLGRALRRDVPMGESILTEDVE